MRLGEEWRGQVLESLGRLFERQESSLLYGPRHALAVENAANATLNASESEFNSSEEDQAVLRTAALLHDVGFANRADDWTADQFEHIQAGQALASQILRQIAFFGDRPERINRVLRLIKYHDDTTYSFPTATLCGSPLLPNAVQHSQPQDRLLTALQEADSLIHANYKCVLEAAKEWQEKLMLPLASDAAPLATWQWMDSIVGNVRLVAKRAILDARTGEGRRAALDSYDYLEAYIQELCRAAGTHYEADACPPSMRDTSVKRMGAKPFDLQILNFHAWSELECTLRAAPLLYDRHTHPYLNANIGLKLLDLDAMTPMALYVLRSRLEEVLELHDALMIAYCVGIWDLPGMLEFRYNSEEVQRLAPPIVEDYVETEWPDKPRILGLIDGLHRCVAARNAGLSAVRTVVARDVPYPLVPLPADWKQVQVYEGHKPPLEEQKRHYRYTSLSEFPFELCQTSNPVTAENYQYFFYRDWNAVGSRGKRDFREFN